ncbi:hypothetical protein NCCNTM_24320 [Mycolicibacterium sp. NCC-Tsukiji]|nr:hypothetical protein NCCNTM_24320 [Mycolicibacterium sp. NCC-Tsukiji]
MKTTGSPGGQLQPARHGRGSRQLGDRAHFVADVTVILEGLLEPDKRVQAVIVFALRNVGADARSPVDQPLGLEDRQGLAHGVAGYRELGDQLGLTRQARRVDPVAHLVAQHVGHLAGAVGAPAQRRRGGLGHAVEPRDLRPSGLHPRIGWFESTRITPPSERHDQGKCPLRAPLRHLENAWQFESR